MAPGVDTPGIGAGHPAGLGQLPPHAVHYPVPIDSLEGGGEKGACRSSSWLAQGHRNYPQNRSLCRRTHQDREPLPSLREQDTPQAGGDRG